MSEILQEYPVYPAMQGNVIAAAEPAAFQGNGTVYYFGSAQQREIVTTPDDECWRAVTVTHGTGATAYQHVGAMCLRCRVSFCDRSHHGCRPRDDWKYLAALEDALSQKRVENRLPWGQFDSVLEDARGNALASSRPVYISVDTSRGSGTWYIMPHPMHRRGHSPVLIVTEAGLVQPWRSEEGILTP